MTNEKAIAIFEEFKVIDDWMMMHLPPMGDAINKEIEALKDVQNCVHCEHYTEVETDTGIHGECKMDTAHSNANQDVQHVGSVDLISRSVAIKTLTDRQHDILAFIEKEDMEYEEAHSYWCEISGIHNSVEILESLPSATCDDCIWHVCNYNKVDWDGEDGYISRRDAIDALQCEWCVEKINNLPSAEPKTGKWIDYSDEGYVECPFCHSATTCDGNKDELHFCFSCGADMRGDKHE